MDTNTTLNIVIRASLKERLAKFAAKHGKSMAEIACQAIEEKINENDMRMVQ